LNYPLAAFVGNFTSNQSVSLHLVWFLDRHFVLLQAAQFQQGIPLAPCLHFLYMVVVTADCSCIYFQYISAVWLRFLPLPINSITCPLRQSINSSSILLLRPRSRFFLPSMLEKCSICTLSFYSANSLDMVRFFQ
jgi:hypothetical protein